MSDIEQRVLEEVRKNFDTPEQAAKAACDVIAAWLWKGEATTEVRINGVEVNTIPTTQPICESVAMRLRDWKDFQFPV